jgi:hypothetical protein
MDIFVYSDESGVFDVAHNEYFVFGGLILLGKEVKDRCERQYAHVEKVLRDVKGFAPDYELKATRLSNSEKNQLYRSLNSFYKFGVVINQKQLHSKVFENKKTKQRYLDFAYKIALKRALQNLINKGLLSIDDVETIHVYVDEHTTATDGRYELKEALEQEFKHGTFNYNYQYFFDPLFPKMKGIELKYCDSASVRLVRASDIVANKLYFLTNSNNLSSIKSDSFFVDFAPFSKDD